jgi:hypothetical protein
MGGKQTAVTDVIDFELPYGVSLRLFEGYVYKSNIIHVMNFDIVIRISVIVHIHKILAVKHIFLCNFKNGSLPYTSLS